MKITANNISGYSLSKFMRKFGYIEHRDPRNGRNSFIRRAKPGGTFYPRFHAYVKEIGDHLEINLHYDWRRPLHKKVARSAEDSGDVVEREAKRINDIVEKDGD
ncbi:MAG: hypothetical protein ACD_63C00014G0006 [uncultured bacterium]|nr:MAG: hypothetical protein ACD_63C00014G0006 [uncultured bacterium]